MADRTTGYSGVPLAKKLGLRDGFKIRLVNPPAYYFDLFDELPANVRVIADKRTKKNFIHIFATEAKTFRDELALLKKEIEPDGMIWASWPKKTAKMAGDISERIVRETALAIGFVDVKVCAVAETWSGLKLVIPMKDRN